MEFDVTARDRSGVDRIAFDIDGEEIGNVVDPAPPRVPYFRFTVADPSVAGVYTPADKIKVQLSYARDGQVMMAPRPLPPVVAGGSANPNYVVPLAADFLPAPWFSSTPTGAHRLRIEITDAADNCPLQMELRFRAEFGAGDCVMQ